jgi:uncharacterized protein (TIGR03067 family)
MRRLALPLMLALPSLAFVPAPFPKQSRPGGAAAELALLQGEWVPVRTTLDGGEVADQGGQVMVVSGRELTHLYRGKVTAAWTIDPDAAARPRRLDLRGRHQGREVSLLQIYRVEGDSLTVCRRCQQAGAGAGADQDAAPALRVGGKPQQIRRATPGAAVVLYNRLQPLAVGSGGK